MTAPAVTVIVPSFNYGCFVAAALESVRAQTTADFECVVVDDGSTDGSLAAIEPFLTDPRFRLLRQQNRGVSHARNRGLELARAPFVAFLDADDLWRPDKLERQLARFRAEPALGVVFTLRTIIDAAGGPLPCTDPPPPEGLVVGPLFRQNFVCFSSAMVRTDAAIRVGGFDERLGLAVDYDFWLRVARHHPFGVVPEPLVAYRSGHGANLSGRQLQRYHVGLYVMHRFARYFDGGVRLDAALAAKAVAETFSNLGVLCRGFSRREAVAWLARAVRADPTSLRTWKRLAAAATPPALVRLARRLTGRSGAWERLYHTPINRPEPVL